MADVAVVNASPLIFLARGDLLDLLRLVGDRVLVPAAVAREILERGPADVTVRALRAAPWLGEVQEPPPPEHIVAWNLGPGETSVLTVAGRNPGSIAVIDDRAGRRCASALGVHVVGTVGLVLRAKRAGRLAEARPTLERLVASGMFLSRSVIDRRSRW